MRASLRNPSALAGHWTVLEFHKTSAGLLNSRRQFANKISNCTQTDSTESRQAVTSFLQQKLKENSTALATCNVNGSPSNHKLHFTLMLQPGVCEASDVKQFDDEVKG